MAKTPRLPNEVFRERLKALRKARGVAQHQLAEDASNLGAEISQAAIALIESGKTKDVSLTHAVAIAAALDVPLEELYQDQVDQDEYFLALAEEPGLTPAQAWQRVWRGLRLGRPEED